MSRRDEIAKLAEAATENGTTLTAEMVVDAAKNDIDYPELHAHLWGVAEAELAQEARVARAHRLLISIRVVTEDGTNTRMMVHTNGTPGYRPVQSVILNPDLAASKLRELAADVARSRHRLAVFKSLLDPELAESIDSGLRKIEDAANSAASARQSTESAA